MKKLKKSRENKDEKTPVIFKDMMDFKFESLRDFLPGFMENKASVWYLKNNIITQGFCFRYYS